MNGKETNQVIVVLGSGRSGTSLLMQVLTAIGMSTSEDMIPAKEQTPTGTYEDREIFQIQNEFISALTPQAMPMPLNWEEKSTLPAIMTQLQKIVADRIEASQTIWGFKDPKTAMLIPMWTRIFNNLNVVPKYILSVRDPQSVVASMKRQYSTRQNVAELFWLTKYTEALQNTGGNCFIVHYEDWFSGRAAEIAGQLQEFCGLTKYAGDTDVRETLDKIIVPNLNRSVYEPIIIKNRYVLKLYEKLKTCRGITYDRQEMMEAVYECRGAMDEFSGWASEAQRFLNRSQSAQRKGSGKTTPELAELEKELRQSILEANTYLKENKELQEGLERLRIQFSSLKHDCAAEKQKCKVEKEQCEVEKHKIKKQNSQLKKENFSLRTSTSFQVGQVFVKAVTKPGKNTLLLPLYLARIILGQKVA